MVMLRQQKRRGGMLTTLQPKNGNVFKLLCFIIANIMERKKWIANNASANFGLKWG